MQASDRLTNKLRILYRERFLKKTIFLLRCDEPAFCRRAIAAGLEVYGSGLCGFDFEPMLPVAISGLHDALPRAGASQR